MKVLIVLQLTQLAGSIFQLSITLLEKHFSNIQSKSFLKQFLSCPLLPPSSSFHLPLHLLFDLLMSCCLRFIFFPVFWFIAIFIFVLFIDVSIYLNFFSFFTFFIIVITIIVLKLFFASCFRFYFVFLFSLLSSSSPSF